jgi:hypothetical protein
LELDNLLFPGKLVKLNPSSFGHSPFAGIEINPFAALRKKEEQSITAMVNFLPKRTYKNLKSLQVHPV